MQMVWNNFSDCCIKEFVTHFTQRNETFWSRACDRLYTCVGQSISHLLVGRLVSRRRFVFVFLCGIEQQAQFSMGRNDMIPMQKIHKWAEVRWVFNVRWRQSDQMSAAERASKAKSVEQANERVRANGGASGPILRPWCQEALNHWEIGGGSKRASEHVVL